LLNSGKTAKYTENTLGYFLIQRATSLVLIFGLLNMEIFGLSENSRSLVFIITPLLIKISAAPFHR